MPVSFEWGEDYGTQTGSPTRGTTRASTTENGTTVTNVNWKNTADVGTAYGSSAITAGNNSYEKWTFGRLAAGSTSIGAGLFANTNGDMGTGLTLKGTPACTGVTPPVAYTTPSTSANAGLSVNMSTHTVIASGVAVWFGITGPQTASKAVSDTSGAVIYTNYLVTQLQTTTSAASSDTATITLTFQYDET
jgi:hypothetical protein